jgi:DNA-binding winged helix-turn-helix (wHTH) protein
MVILIASRELLTSVRLLKLDLEGMDVAVMHAVVDYYQQVTRSELATHLWPCVLFFETNTLSVELEVERLLRRLSDIGRFVQTPLYLSLINLCNIRRLCQPFDEL